ncbi:MAG: ParA family protein [Pseudanabaena sp.]|jgi:chromosome partitioning protein
MQSRIAVLSNAGGSGKTTLSVHIAYEMSLYGLSVALMDLDPQGSLSLFCGLPQPEPEQTLASVLGNDFTGQWPLEKCWTENTNKVDVVQGGMILTRVADEMVLHRRGAYLLGDCLKDHPISHDLIIFDCPATLGPLTLLALSACTHVLVPVQLEPKSIQGSAKLIEWVYHNSKQLRLDPQPQVMGFVPNQYDARRATHRQILEDLPTQLDQLGIHCFPPIRDSAEFINASGQGLPLHLYRHQHPAQADFKEVSEHVVQLIGKKVKRKK